MRAVVLAIALLGFTSSAWATRIHGARSFGYGDDPPNTIVPAYPSMFIELGYDGPQDLPVFSTGTGKPIAIRRVTNIPTAHLQRVDLDIADGQIVVRLPGERTPVATYVVDPAFHPKTHLVEVNGPYVLRVDSDAVAFRDVGCDRDCVEFNDGLVFLDRDHPQRILALYPNGSEAVIFESSDGRQFTPNIRLKAMDLSPLPATLLLLLILGVIGVRAARTD